MDIYLVIGVMGLLFVLLGVGMLSVSRAIESLSIRVAGLERGRAGQVEEITQTLTDPDMLDAELEKSANLTEMRRANRRHLPRPDAGPPARVNRLKIFRD